MKVFAFAKVEELLAVMTSALDSAAKAPDADAVHDLRVSIRRLQQGLRLFRQYLAKSGVKKVRKQMKRIMEHAGEVRNYDICIELAAKAGRSVPVLSERREAARQLFAATLLDIQSPELHDSWRTALGIHQP
jgi:CHAD domain-containing protein